MRNTQIPKRTFAYCVQSILYSTKYPQESWSHRYKQKTNGKRMYKFQSRHLRLGFTSSNYIRCHMSSGKSEQQEIPKTHGRRLPKENWHLQ